MEEAPDDYFNSDGTPNQNGIVLADKLRRTLREIIIEEPSQNGICRICLDHKRKTARELVAVGLTSKKKLTVILCPECDGEALDNAQQQPL